MELLETCLFSSSETFARSLVQGLGLEKWPMVASGFENFAGLKAKVAKNITYRHSFDRVKEPGVCNGIGGNFASAT